MEGDIIRSIENNHQYFGHYHTAGNPGRHELDDSQEIYYPPIAKAIAAVPYDGYFVHEFIPIAMPLQAIGSSQSLHGLMKIAYLTAGAAGMFCGSCMLDNALAKSMIRMGHECLLVPLYTPIRTDEEDVSIDQVFFGGHQRLSSAEASVLEVVAALAGCSAEQAGLVRRLTKNTARFL